MKYLFTAFLLIISSSLIAQKDYSETIDKLDSLYKKALTEWEVPGMAIAIVKDGKVIFEKGYGVKNIKGNEKVDEFTMFPIASVTKGFTSTAIGELVSEGKINWDDKVRDYLPWFKLYNPYVSENMTIRDLLCHRSGLVTFSGDLLWYGTNYDREEVIRRAQYLEPAYGFRTNYGYSNIMFITAGEIIEKVTGSEYDEYIRETFFEPLNMQRSVSSIDDLEQYSNVTSPHTDYENEIIAIDFLNWDNIGAAGNIISCVDDMAKWLILHLNSGVYNEDTLFNSEIQNQLWKPHTIQDLGYFDRQYFPTTHFKSYGLGFALRDLYGKKIVSHSGGYDGIITQMALVPEEELGMIVLTNRNSWLILPVMYQTLQAFLTDEHTDFSTEFLRIRNYVDQMDEKKEKDREENRIKNTEPSLEPEAYTGTYHDEMYGDATVYLQGSLLKVRLEPAPLFVGDMNHYHYDVYEVEMKNFPSLPKGLITFTLNSKGKVNTMVIDIPNPDFDFTEMEFIKQEEEEH